MQSLVPALLNRKTILYGNAFLMIAFFAACGARELIPNRAQGSDEEAGEVSVNLRAKENKESFAASDDVILQVTITNSSDEAVKILKWFTPVEGVQGALFSVLLDNEPVNYIGRMYRRAAPTTQDYIALEAGESIHNEVNLVDFYDFSISGNYEIRYDVSSQQLYSGAGEGNKPSVISGSLTSTAVRLYIEGRPTSAP